MTITSAPHAFLGFVTSQDVRLMQRVSRWRPPRWVRWWMIGATRAGDGCLWYAQGLVFLLAGGSQGLAATEAGLLACGFGILVFEILKRSIGRQRPSVLERHNWARLLPPDEFSFPSGHTITAFAFAVAVTHYFPFLLLWLLFCAVSVAASRIVLGMHFLSDVLAGCAIGCGIGSLACLVVH
ncbi:MAG TPA: phosphatase PAP2 family protein [Terriglobia bacterium]|jgi:undecaprenyl-diphosphatase|nr:phosphatase PAP2 family protein [Terriglobia bacterium]